MKTKLVAIALSALIAFTSCVSKTLIQSNPQGATVYIDSQPVGVTPCRYSDRHITGTSVDVRLEKEGFKTLTTTISKSETVNVGAIFGGVCLLVPFLWVMGYQNTYMYPLEPAK